MVRYIAVRLGQSVVILIGVTIILFLLQHSLPGGPASAILGSSATPVSVHAFNVQYGLDKSLVQQYGIFFNHLLHGNLGYSYRLNQSVDSLLALDLPKTLLLVGVALAIAVLAAIPIGLLQAARRKGAFDNAFTGIFFVLYSMPSFWLGLLLISLLSVKAHLLPSEAPQGSTVGQVIKDPVGLVLPVLTLALINVALFSRYVRSSAIDSLAQEYIRLGRAKGLSEFKLITRHVLRNSLGPVVTLLGLALPWIFTSGLVIEQIFNYPGSGLLFFTSATSRDYPVELGLTLVTATATVLGNLLSDLAYAVLDPRVKYR